MGRKPVDVMTAPIHQRGDEALFELKQGSVEVANQNLLGRQRFRIRQDGDIAERTRLPGGQYRRGF